MHSTQMASVSKFGPMMAGMSSRMIWKICVDRSETVFLNKSTNLAGGDISCGDDISSNSIGNLYRKRKTGVRWPKQTYITNSLMNDEMYSPVWLEVDGAEGHRA